MDVQITHRYPNPYENHPRNITNKKREIVTVSDQVKQDLINAARDSMENHNGMLNEKSPFFKNQKIT
ncbi:hypothetical protein [Oceanobacillus sp. CFH 90083]|uniref:hypothetical protein n=1 Tax=Oceanobacillus sp. CFH 90083 TaxID=2592336 RepID=UPI00128B431C|nr:hypothetical protein [Oceanobacillus sp. CFH 90083]